MPVDLDELNELHRREMNCDDDTAFEKWCDEVEASLDDVLPRNSRGEASLDGDQVRDGYSLDDAATTFLLGIPPDLYAARVRQAIEWRRRK